MESCQTRPVPHTMSPWWMLLLFVVVSPVQPAEIVQVDVVREDGAYTLSLELLVSAPPATVQRLLTDYGQLGALNSAIQESLVLERGNGRDAVVRIVIRSCLALLCVDLTQVQAFSAGDGEIMATFVPNRGDFRSGWVHWRFLSEEKGTRVYLDAKLQPDFWVPPLIGNFLIKRYVRKQTLKTLNSIERRFRISQQAAS